MKIMLVFFSVGVTLSEAGASVTWDPEIKDDYPCNFKLIIKQILLGHQAKENEYNVVQVNTNRCIQLIHIFDIILIVCFFRL